MASVLIWSLCGVALMLLGYDKPLSVGQAMVITGSLILVIKEELKT